MALRGTNQAQPSDGIEAAFSPFSIGCGASDNGRLCDGSLGRSELVAPRCVIGGQPSGCAGQAPLSSKPSPPCAVSTHGVGRDQFHELGMDLTEHGRIWSMSPALRQLFQSAFSAHGLPQPLEFVGTDLVQYGA